ncbi:MAG: ABC transporter ATP-binding protein [Candidatus Komeilibacteria bacterium]
MKISWETEKNLLISFGFLSLLVGLIPFYSSGVNAILINGLIDSAQGKGSVGYIIILLVIFGYVLPDAIYIILHYMDKKYWLRLGQKFELMLLKKLGSLDMATHEDKQFSDLLQRAMERGMFPLIRLGNTFFVTIQSAITVIVASIVLLSFDPLIFALILISAVPNLIVELKYGRGLWSIYDMNAENRRQFFSFRNSFYNLYSLVEMKVFQSVRHFYQRLKGMTNEFTEEQQINERKKVHRALAVLTVSVLTMVISIILIIGKASSGAIQIGTMTFILAAVNRLQDSFHGFMMNIARQYEESLFVTDIFKVLDTEPYLTDSDDAIDLDTQLSRIVFENVDFSYPGSDKLVLRNFNLIIEPNQKLAILGINGAGKTTLIKLLCRFYDPIAGKITVNGIDLQEIKQESWLKQLGVIFQDYADYNLTVEQSIALGDTSIALDSDRVKKAATSAQANAFIEEYGSQYQQMLGRRFSDGVEPSKGQRQRLALARLFYRNPNIMILDEPTASIDAEAEMKIFDELETNTNRSVIVVSQRYSTVKNADKIIVIDDGEIIEEGNHKQLMAADNTYARLFKAQAARYA